MSLSLVKEELRRFLMSQIPEVMAIRGKWGVGKTYSWNKILEEVGSENIRPKRYVYISLFGLCSLKDLKYSLFEQAIDTDMIGEKLDVVNFQDNIVKFSESLARRGAKGIYSLLNIIPGLGQLSAIAPLVESLAFMSVRDYLVCIDDLERKGDGLSLRDVLGLVLQLKEQRNCKVVFLFNDNEEGLDEFKENREKVVDIELLFDPSAKECVEIALSHNDYIDGILAECIQMLDLKNIRIIKKIDRMVGIVKPKITTLEKGLQVRIVKDIALLASCYYRSNNDNKPSFDYVLKNGYDLYANGEEKNEEMEVWNRFLRDYGYRGSEKIEKVLSCFVKNGYLVDDEFDILVRVENEAIIKERSSDQFHLGWERFHYSFENNQEEVVEKIYNGFVLGIKNISPLNLDASVRLFRELGRGDKADDMIKLYVQEYDDEYEVFNLNDNVFSGEIKDDKLKDVFAKAYKNKIIKESFNDVLIKIVETNAWSEENIYLLSNQSVDAYYDLFKSQSGKQFLRIVNQCLDFGKYNDSDGYKKMITNKAKEALKKIGSESLINKIRVRRYGIKME